MCYKASRNLNLTNNMHSYPLLQRVSELYEEVGLGNVLLLACQHLLEPQKRMFEHLFQMGLKPENCVVVGKNYSTSAEVLRELEVTGSIVAPFSHEFDPLVSFDSWFEEKLSVYIASEISRRPMAKYDKVIILDDGGFMHLVANKLCSGLTNIVGIEQTSSGHHKIQDAGVKFRSISVARSYQKLMYESPYIGKCGTEKTLRYLKETGLTDPKILIMGLGHIGRQMAGQFLCSHKLAGAVFDPGLDNIHKEPFGLKGVFDLLRPEHFIRSEDELRTRLPYFDVIIGTSGKEVLRENDLSELHPKVSLISMSSSDREFPAVPFRNASGTLHQNYRLEGRTLVNGGFPITFDGLRHAMPPQQIELTIALLMIRVLDAITGDLQQLEMVVEQIRMLWQPTDGASEWYENYHLATKV